MIWNRTQLERVLGTKARGVVSWNALHLAHHDLQARITAQVVDQIQHHCAPLTLHRDDLVVERLDDPTLMAKSFTARWRPATHRVLLVSSPSINASASWAGWVVSTVEHPTAFLESPYVVEVREHSRKSRFHHLYLSGWDETTRTWRMDYLDQTPRSRVSKSA